MSSGPAEYRMLTPRQREVLEERQYRVAEVLDWVTAPAQGIIIILKIIFWILVGIGVTVGTPIYWFYEMVPHQQAANDYLAKGSSVYTLHFDQPINGPNPIVITSESGPNNAVARAPAWTKTGLCDIEGMTYKSRPYYTRLDYMHSDPHRVFWSNYIFDRNDWARNKQVPMFTAYLRAMETEKALREFFEIPGALPAQLPGAPVIRMAYTQKPYLTPSGTNFSPTFLILGMCLASECEAADFQYQPGRDYFGITVTPHQQHAIDALEAIQGDEFWLGIWEATDRKYYIAGSVKWTAQQNRDRLNSLFE